MAGSSFGTIFKITTWGESHGPAVGVVIDGCPSGLSLSEADVQPYLDRRRPGQNSFTTPRKESDTVHFLSGVFEGKTTGAPLSMVVYNESQRSGDYATLKDVYRPGHADFTFDQKYGFRDYRGGGRSSARETIARVAAGAVAIKILSTLGVSLCTYAKEIGPIKATTFSAEAILKNPLNMPDLDAAQKAMELCQSIQEQYDSLGGIVECIVTGMPVGVGEPVFEKLDANLAKALFSIGAVKGVEIGDGFAVSTAKGSDNNDEFSISGDEISKVTNHAGGVLGGISDGSDLIIRATFKPTPSIFKKQSTVTTSKEKTAIQINGRHDPLVVPRAVVVVEAMTALTVLDLLFLNMSSRLSRIENFYKNN